MTTKEQDLVIRREAPAEVSGSLLSKYEGDISPVDLLAGSL